MGQHHKTFPCFKKLQENYALGASPTLNTVGMLKKKKKISGDQVYLNGEKGQAHSIEMGVNVPP